MAAEQVPATPEQAAALQEFKEAQAALKAAEQRLRAASPTGTTTGASQQEFNEAIEQAKAAGLRPLRMVVENEVKRGLSVLDDLFATLEGKNGK